MPEPQNYNGLQLICKRPNLSCCSAAGRGNAAARLLPGAKGKKSPKPGLAWRRRSAASAKKAIGMHLLKTVERRRSSFGRIMRPGLRRMLTRRWKWSSKRNRPIRGAGRSHEAGLRPHGLQTTPLTALALAGRPEGVTVVNGADRRTDPPSGAAPNDPYWPPLDPQI